MSAKRIGTDPSNLAAWLSSTMKLYGRGIAINENGNEASYEELDRKSDLLAARILRDFEEITSPVPIVQSGFINAAISILGVLKSGKTASVLNPNSPEKYLIDLFDNLEAELLITDEKSVCTEKFNNRISVLPVSCNEERLEYEWNQPTIDNERAAFVVFTSGSSGQPKGVIRSHYSIVQNTLKRLEIYRLSQADRVMITSDLQFGRTLDIFICSLLSGSLLFSFDPKHVGVYSLPQWLHDNEINVFNPTSSLLRTFTKLISKSSPFPHIKLIRIGGELLYSSDLNPLKEVISSDCRIWLSYGSSETGSICANVFNLGDEIKEGVLPVGYAIEDKRVNILVNSKTINNYNEPGEVVVESDQLFSGYWKDEKLFQEKAVRKSDGTVQFHTGDLGKWLSDGSLQLLGRRDRMVKVRGFRVELSAIESIILAVENVEDVVVTVIENKPGFQVIVALVVLSKGTIEEVRQVAQSKLPEYMIPARFLTVNEIPKLDNHKVDLIRLKELVSTLSAVDDYSLSSPGTTESKLQKIWQEALNTRIPNVDTPFVHLGGDSLSTAIVLNEIEKLFDIQLTTKDFLSNPTISELAAIIEGRVDTNKLKSAESKSVQSVWSEVSKPRNKRNRNRVGSLWFRSVKRKSRSQSYWSTFLRISNFTFIQLPYRVLVRVLSYPASVRLTHFIVRAKLDGLLIPKKVSNGFSSFSAILAGTIQREFQLKSRWFFLLNYYSAFQKGREGKMVKVNVRGMDMLNKLRDEGKGVILLGNHTYVNKWLSTLELDYITLGWVGNLLRSRGLDPAKYTKIFQTQQMMKAIKILSDGGIVHIVADGNNGSGASMPGKILGKERSFKTAFAELAIKTKSAVIPIAYTMDTPFELSIVFLDPLLVTDLEDSEVEIRKMIDRFVETIDSIYRTNPWIVTPEQINLLCN